MCSDPSAMKVTQTMTVDGRFVDARQVGVERANRDLLGAARDRGAAARRAPPAAGCPSWRFHDLRTGRRFVRQVAACGTIRRPVQFSGLGMLSIVTVDFNEGLAGGAVDLADGRRADRLRLEYEPLHRDPAVGQNPLLAVGQLPSGQTR